MPCLPFLRRPRRQNHRFQPPDQPNVYQIEFHSYLAPGHQISTIQRLSVLQNPENINLVSASVVKDLQREIEPCEGTVEIYGSIVGIKGSVVLEWVFEEPRGSGIGCRTQQTRFYVPNIANPFFDATFAQRTARKYGIN